MSISSLEPEFVFNQVFNKNLVEKILVKGS